MPMLISKARVLAGLALASLALAACADQPPLLDRLSNGRVQGDADHASIAAERLDALPLAVAHCARYGKSAQFVTYANARSEYRCVASPS